MDTSPGPHPSDDSLPLSVSLRENLNIARNRREAEKILSDGQIKVDGKVRRKPRYPVGLMDVVEIPKTGEAWRVLHDRKGYLQFIEIDSDEAGFKLEKVVRKNQFKGDRIQLTFHDGKTVVGEYEDIDVDDTVKVSLPDLDILEHVPCQEGNLALITGGTNVGKRGKISDILEIEGPSSDRFLVETDGEEFQSPEQYIFVIGKDSAEVSFPGGD